MESEEDIGERMHENETIRNEKIGVEKGKKTLPEEKTREKTK